MDKDQRPNVSKLKSYADIIFPFGPYFEFQKCKNFFLVDDKLNI
jgi:hypothetical protein